MQRTDFVSILGGQFLFQFKFDWQIKDAVKALGSKYDPQTQTWLLPVNHESAARVADFLETHESFLASDTAKDILAEKAPQRGSISQDGNGFSRPSNRIEVEGVDLEDKIQIPGLYPYQNEGVAYALKQRRAIIADELGCIAGDATLNLNRAGKGFKISLEKAYKRFHGKDRLNWNWDPSIPTYARALVDGELHQHRVLDILDQGIKHVVEVEFASGKRLKATPDHEFASPDGGWIQASSLQSGDEILGNGIPTCRECGSTENITSYKYAKFVGYCRTCIYRTLRAKPTWIGGKFFDADGYVHVSGQWDHPRHSQGGSVYEHILVMERELGHYVEWPSQVHHINSDRSDNRIENLELVTPSNHHVTHKKYRHMEGGRGGHGGEIKFAPSIETVVAVRAVGFTRVYDLVMEAPHHNFCANGIIVHNCGKTIQALAAIQHEEAYPAVIVCKNINKFNWERETEQWTDAEVDLVFGRKPYMFITDVVIINYEILQYHVDSIRQLQPKALIIDESQYTKNGKASRTKAAKEVAQMIPHDGLVLLLTGTPIVNRPSEIISQLQIIDRLKSLGGWRRFVDNYIGWDYVPVRGSRQQRKIVDPHGAQHLTELNRKLRKLCYIRRLKSDVLQELPEMTRTVMEVELSNREEYEQVKENFLYAVRQSVAEQYGDLDSDDFQAILAEKIEKALSAEQLREAQELRRTTARGKLEATIEWVQDFLDQEGDQKMVLFAYHRDIQKALIDAFPNCVRLIGLQDMTARERYQEEQRFWNTDVQIAVASLEAAKEGLNLQCASQVAFIELGWTPAGMAQAEGRIHRMGQDRGTTSYWIIGQDSFDQKIQELLEAKEQVTSALTEG